ncbi:MAG: hypothetical protein ACRDNZ_08875, partial [Streptosporangiaceae bacterium]
VANTTYSSSLNAVVLTTTGQPTTVTTACAHIRSQHTVPTSGDVVEAKVYLPGLSLLFNPCFLGCPELLVLPGVSW